MTVDLERLRTLAALRAKFFRTAPEDMEEWQAAEEIAELREAMKPAVEIVEVLDHHNSDDWVPVQTWKVKALRDALTKLEGGSNDR